MTDRETAVDRLHAVPLEEFVAERKRLAKELRDAGDRDAAADVAKLAKPSAPAWALNRLARDQPGVVGDWLEAADALREASANPRATGRDALRSAIAAHRDATRQVLAAVRDGVRPNGRKLSEPMLERVRELLQAATVDPDESELLRAGRILERDEDAQPPADLAAEEAAEKPAARAPKQRVRERAAVTAREAGEEERPAKQRTEEQRAAREREAREREAAELERLVAAARERAAELDEAVGEREEAVAAAEARLDEARRALYRSESEVEAARDAVAEARDAADDAARELATLTAKLRRTGSS